MVSDRQWAQDRVERFPRRWQSRLLAAWGRHWTPFQGDTWTHAQAEKNAAANRLLYSTSEALRACRLTLDASDGEICARADELADQCAQLAQVWHSLPDLRAAMERKARAWGVEPPPKAKKNKNKDGPAVARMVCPKWWRRALRKMHAKAVEGAAIGLGFVNRDRDCYVSNESLTRRAQQNRRNAEALESTIARNEEGQEFTLAELAAKGTSNKSIRRAELMTRIAGFERIAKDMGHAGMFFTVTAPSRMHKWRTIKAGGRVVGVKENPRYDGTKPREAQEHLAAVWARIRAALDRRGVSLYGFRICEPNHDGTPHWHFLCFHSERTDSGNRLMPRIAAIVRRYALGRGEVEEPNHFESCYRRTPFRYKKQAVEYARGLAEAARHKWAVAERARQNAEPGAKLRRCDFKTIDWERGSAAGYIAKYVAKNIDGYKVEKDLYGNDAMETSARVEAWASTWNVRQFQQVGGPPVGPWRELRRVKSVPVTAPDYLKQAHEAVNRHGEAETETFKAAAWDRYCKAQGGVFCGRRYRIRISTAARDGLTSYGEPKAPAIVGVEVREFYTPKHMEWMTPPGRALRVLVVESARHRWEIVTRKGGRSAVQSARSAPWTRVNNCTEGGRDGSKNRPPSGGSGSGGGLEWGTAAHQGDGRGIRGADFGGAASHEPGNGRFAGGAMLQ